MFLFSGFGGRRGSVFWVSGEGGVRFLGLGRDLPATSGGWPGAGGMGWPALEKGARGGFHYLLFKEIQ
jgi:hypothetical protein